MPNQTKKINHLATTFCNKLFLKFVRNNSHSNESHHAAICTIKTEFREKKMREIAAKQSLINQAMCKKYNELRPQLLAYRKVIRFSPCCGWFLSSIDIGLSC